MDLKPDAAISLCQAAHQRLIARLSALTDEQARQPSLLPGWTVGHVLTHISRNADGHCVRLEGALWGEEIPRYPGGGEQRDREIEEGAGRSAAELVADVTESCAKLEAVWQRCEEAGWPHSHLLAGDQWETFKSPVRRLREVEIHHLDLGLGYQVHEWSAEYAGWELNDALSKLSARVNDPESREFLLWLIGRRQDMPTVQLGPWS